MVVTISKMFDFDAAHWLPNVPDGHKCKRLHGHTYRVEVRIGGEPDQRGFICDYAEIAAAWKPIEAAIDHRTLNEIPGLENPSTEVLAPWILERFMVNMPAVTIESVRVYESSTTYCEVFRNRRTREELIAAAKAIRDANGSCPGYLVGDLILEDLRRP